MDKILIAPAPLAGLDASFVPALRNAGFELIYPKRRLQLLEAELLEQLQGIKAVVAGSEPYTRKVLDAHPQLRVIARAGVGYDAVDVAAASERGIAVTITPNTNQDAVAEHTFALILAIAKSVIPQHLGTIAGQWPRRATLPLRGRTLGIAGLGRIGKAVAIRGQCFGMKLFAYEPYPDHAFIQQYGIELVPFERLLTDSDFLTLHMPATAEARHIINRATLARMKPTAYFVNTARGALVNEGDLVEALQNKTIAGAAIDVFELEPPGDHPLFHLDNVVVTPHAAGVDLQSRDDMALSAAQAIISFSRGEWPAEKVVNAEVRGKFRW
ncbi:MAG: phosphoglycerate dehydrogenase [Gemmataceae bacterium]|nr:phosphoglycerate dehydrogenase [Gemmataceae bacterium]